MSDQILAQSCFVCRTELSSVNHDSDLPHVPYKGTVFTASGNFGSTVYDPVMSYRGHLSINVCDSCMLDRKDLVLSVSEVYVPAVYKVLPWDPDLDNGN